MPFHDDNCIITWENSSVRSWLNSDFLNEAFSDYEKNMILSAEISNPPNPEYLTYCGNDTVDKIFLLNVQEISDYFPSEYERRAIATQYAKDKELFVNGEGYSNWLTRSQGSYPISTCYVHCNGVINIIGSMSVFEEGIRPAMWIKTDLNT